MQWRVTKPARLRQMLATLRQRNFALLASLN
jgi:hypothetical protein